MLRRWVGPHHGIHTGRLQSVPNNVILRLLGFFARGDIERNNSMMMRPGRFERGLREIAIVLFTGAHMRGLLTSCTIWNTRHFLCSFGMGVYDTLMFTADACS